MKLNNGTRTKLTFKNKNICTIRKDHQDIYLKDEYEYEHARREGYIISKPSHKSKNDSRTTILSTEEKGLAYDNCLQISYDEIENFLKKHKPTKTELYLIQIIIHLNTKLDIIMDKIGKNQQLREEQIPDDQQQQTQNERQKRKHNVPTYKVAREYKRKKTQLENNTSKSDKANVELQNETTDLDNPNKNLHSNLDNNREKKKNNKTSNQKSTTISMNTTTDQPEITTYIYNGNSLAKYYNDNKRIEFTTLDNEIKKAYSKASIEHVSITKHDNEYKLKIRTLDKQTKIKLEDQKVQKTMLMGITLQDKHVTTSTRPIIMYATRVPDAYNELDPEERKFLHDKYSVINVKRKIFDNNRKSNTISMEVESEEKAYQLMTTSMVFHSTKCSVIPQIKHPNICVDCTSYGHLSAQCTNAAKCFRCGGDHHYSECNSDELCCVHCRNKGSDRETIRHTIIDHEICPIYQEEYTLANKRIFEVVDKYNAKLKLEFRVPIFKNNRLFETQENQKKKIKLDSDIENRLLALESKFDNQCNTIRNEVRDQIGKIDEKVELIKMDYECFKQSSTKIDSIFDWIKRQEQMQQQQAQQQLQQQFQQQQFQQHFLTPSQTLQPVHTASQQMPAQNISMQS